MIIENINIKNISGQTINSASDETVLLLRKMVKMLESNTVVDANMKQRVIIDSASSCIGAYTMGVGGTNYPIVSAPSASATIYYMATWAGPIDPRWTNVEQARISYNVRIRKNLI